MKTPIGDSLGLLALKLLPKNLISVWLGRLAEVQKPKWFVKFQIWLFVRIFGVNIHEAKRSVEQFASLQEFFTRELKDGVRLISNASEAIVSPCDGIAGQCGTVEHGLLLQIKGKSYRLGSLLSEEAWTEPFEGGSYATLYLSPKDYHCFHVPFDLWLAETIYLPGYLWPVNPFGVRNVDELFCVNERVVMAFSRTPGGAVEFIMVAVGATVVGKIGLYYDQAISAKTPEHTPRRNTCQPPRLFKKGEPIGYFAFGSTLVLIMDPKLGTIDIHRGTPVQLGTQIGRCTKVA